MLYNRISQDMQVTQPRPKARPGSDTVTLQLIYEQNIRAIYQFIYSRVGNREEAEDLTSHVFMRALPLLETDREVASIRSWLFQVARTTIADFWRERYRAPTIPLDFVTHTTGASGGDSEEAFEGGNIVQDDWSEAFLGRPAENEAGVEEAAVLVEQILTSLPANYRQILILRFLRGYSIREAATEMGISESNAKVLQYRALQKAALSHNL